LRDFYAIPCGTDTGRKERKRAIINADNTGKPPGNCSVIDFFADK